MRLRRCARPGVRLTLLTLNSPDRAGPGDPDWRVVITRTSLHTVSRPLLPVELAGDLIDVLALGAGLVSGEEQLPGSWREAGPVSCALE